MRRQISRNLLYQMEQEIIGYQKQNPALAMLLEQKVSLFYQRCGMELKITKDRFRSIQEKFVQKDEDGKFTGTGEGDNFQWKFIESPEALAAAGIKDISLVKQEYDKACQALFSQVIIIEW